jgi:hypothetical protein
VRGKGAGRGERAGFEKRDIKRKKRTLQH